MEAAMVTVIIGVGVVAMMQLLAAGTVSNSYATEMTTAVNLANNIHEITVGLPFYDPDTAANAQPLWLTPESSTALYDDLLDFDGKTFTPPLDVRRQPMTAYPNWSQQIAIETVAADNVTSVRPDTTTEPTARVTVTILHNGKAVHQMSWLAVAPPAD